MGILKFIVFNILGQASLLVGCMALLGLLLQRKSAVDVITGTLKTITGFLIFGIGASAAAGALTSFQTLFSEGFHLTGVLPLAEAVTALAQTKFSLVIALVMALGFVANLIFARLTKFKFIFLTGQHSLFFAAMLTVLFKFMGLSDLATIILGSVILGVGACVYPAICQRYMREITGNDSIAMGHYCTIAYGMSGWIGSKVGDKSKSTEQINLPKWLLFLKDYVVSISLTMGVFYYITAVIAGKASVQEVAGGTNWLLYPLIQSLTFAGGLFVVITGIRMLLGEIVPAFVGISEKLIPDAKPALDCPVVFPYAPTATVIGFISAYCAGLICMFIFAALKMPVIIPVAVPYFFIGATAGVFGNATGGWKGCVAGAFVTGILIAVGPALMYPVFADVGLVGSCFPETDFNFIGYIIFTVGKLLGMV
ncbi:MAG TPA: PTS ascorbate transporter subunit IIC [Anaerovoracaceae bacterium]|nr:PTS ascorbate transporter subunit IIC [Anaerovoracaceae bacterium]